MGNSTIALTDDSFQKEVLESNGVVIVDFWATWCGPCRQIAPILDELANDYAGKGVVVAKVDVDNNSKVASQYGILSIPTLLFFRNGEVVEKVVGLKTKQQLAFLVDRHLAA